MHTKMGGGKETLPDLLDMGLESYGLDFIGTRITSYNVCYTKLLRIKGGCDRGHDFGSLGLHRVAEIEGRYLVRVASGAFVGFGGSLPGTAENKADGISFRPTLHIHNLLKQGGQIRGLLIPTCLMLGVPCRNIAPVDGCSGQGAGSYNFV